jgi:hypothetical protein
MTDHSFSSSFSSLLSTTGSAEHGKICFCIKVLLTHWLFYLGHFKNGNDHFNGYRSPVHQANENNRLDEFQRIIEAELSNVNANYPPPPLQKPLQNTHQNDDDEGDDEEDGPSSPKAKKKKTTRYKGGSFVFVILCS